MVFSDMSEGIISAAAVDQIVSVSESVIEVVGGAAVVVGVCVLQFCILFGYGTVDVGVLLVAGSRKVTVARLWFPWVRL